MPSSTSSSETLRPDSPGKRGTDPRQAPGKALIAAVLLAAAVFLGLLEVGIRYGFSRVSRIESRTLAEYRMAQTIRRQAGATSILLVGNSLLLEGIDLPILRSSLPESVRVYRFSIEGTGLLDWQYGVRRLFADGSRPDILLVILGATQILPTQIRGDYSAYYLFRTGDLPEISRTLGYDLTKESSLYFARYSLLFAGRNNLRNFTLNSVDRRYADVLHELAARPEKAQNRALVAKAAAERLGDIRRTSAANGARVIFTVAPGFFREDGAGALAGARSAGVEILEVVPQGQFDASLFRDGFHLSEKGAAIFTRLFASHLREIIR